eukprot:279416_1
MANLDSTSGYIDGDGNYHDNSSSAHKDDWMYGNPPNIYGQFAPHQTNENKIISHLKENFISQFKSNPDKLYSIQCVTLETPTWDGSYAAKIASPKVIRQSLNPNLYLRNYNWTESSPIKVSSGCVDIWLFHFSNGFYHIQA